MKTAEKRLSYNGYELVFEDDFNAPTLCEDNWNVELHEPGWVNAEWQRYVDSPDNIRLEAGNLLLRPVKTADEEGNTVYTSGRINTKGKREFTYGIFEARAKVPAGMGIFRLFGCWRGKMDLSGRGPSAAKSTSWRFWVTKPTPALEPFIMAFPIRRNRAV